MNWCFRIEIAFHGAEQHHHAAKPRKYECEIIKLVADINKTSLFFSLKFDVVVSRRTHLVSMQCSINF